VSDTDTDTDDVAAGDLPAPEPVGITPFHVSHINILTRDWRRSLAFYAQAFGARYQFHLGPRKVVTEIGGFEFFMEEVDEFVVNPFFHFGFRTTPDGVHAFARRLERLGIPMVAGNNPAPGPMTGPDGVRVALYIEDPDGWLIEVYSPEQLVIDSGLLGRDPRWEVPGER
jgi:catechol 2,3-dioxygenase-like lactoylglutathione lyase family enzyme